MKLRSKSYILRGALAGLLAGNVLARTLFNNPSSSGTEYIATFDPRSIVMILASIGAGAFIGHILRHQSVEDEGAKIVKPNQVTNSDTKN